MWRIPANTQAVLFDLDGTLVDHIGAAEKAIEAWCAHLGLNGGQLDRWLAVEAKWFAAYERGEVSHVGQRVERCREFLARPDLSEAAALNLYEHYLTAYRESCLAFPDAADAVDEALGRGLQVGILTNGTATLQTRKMERSGLWRKQLHMLATVELGAPKPQPQAYRLALKILGCSPQRAVMIGDSWANDVAGARAAGLGAHYLLRPGQQRDPRCPADEPVLESLVHLSWD